MIMSKKDKRTEFQISVDNAQMALNAVNDRVAQLGVHALYLYESIERVQKLFDAIRGLSEEDKRKYDEIKKRTLEWRQQVDSIKEQYNSTLRKEGVGGAVGTGIGVSVAMMGPTVAMGVATTFGVASTGTAISELAGAAATKAALAWLGGGALSAGGGGMAAGKALLALAGPVGWTLAGCSAVICGIFIWKTVSDNKKLERIFTLISERDRLQYQMARTEMDSKILEIPAKTQVLNDGAMMIQSFGTEYSRMTEHQQYVLGTYLNLLQIAADLLTKPILGLQPRYSESDLKRYMGCHTFRHSDKNEEKGEAPKEGIIDDYDYFKNHQELLVAFSDLLCSKSIQLQDSELKLLAKTFKKNKEFLETAGIKEDVIKVELFQLVKKLLAFKYSLA